MASAFQLWILVVALVVDLEGAIAQDCNKTYTARSFTDCSKLESLGAFLAWSLHSSNHTIDFAFTEDANSVAGWVGWGINTTGGLMRGTQALEAFWDTAWANVVVVYEYDLTVAVAFHLETPPYPI